MRCKACNEPIESLDGIAAEYCDEKCAADSPKSFHITFTSIAALLMQRGKSVTQEQAKQILEIPAECVSEAAEAITMTCLPRIKK